MQTKVKDSWLQKNPKKTLFTIVVLLVLVLDFFLTGIFHYFKYGTIHKYGEQDMILARSPYFHHTFKPNATFQARRWGHVTSSFSSNSLGFKDQTSQEISLASDIYRILFMGDSFTEGVGYEYQNTFVGLIDQTLASDNIEVLNAAVASYAPSIYFKKTEYLLNSLHLNFDELVVFLDISDIQDEAESYDIQNDKVVWIGDSEALTQLKNFLYEYSTLPRNIWSMSRQLGLLLDQDPDFFRSDEERHYAINQQRSLWTINHSTYERYGELGLTKAKQHMDMLYQLTHRNQITMTLAVYPWPDQIFHKDTDSKQVRFWKEWAKNHNVHFINYFPEFIHAGDDPKDVITKYFIPGDNHWNSEGHKLIAEHFLKYWKRTISQDNK